jgi:hypothetical protein
MLPVLSSDVPYTPTIPATYLKSIYVMMAHPVSLPLGIFSLLLCRLAYLAGKLYERLEYRQPEVTRFLW